MVEIGKIVEPSWQLSWAGVVTVVQVLMLHMMMRPLPQYSLWTCSSSPETVFTLLQHTLRVTTPLSEQDTFYVLTSENTFNRAWWGTTG